MKRLEEEEKSRMMKLKKNNQLRIDAVSTFLRRFTLNLDIKRLFNLM